SRLLRYSLKNEIPEASRIAARIARVSNNPLPSGIATIAETTTAKRRILMMGLSKFFRYCFQSGARSGGVSTFVPYRFRLSPAFRDESPFSPANSLILSSASMSHVPARDTVFLDASDVLASGKDNTILLYSVLT